MRAALILLLLAATSASAQTGAPTRVTASLGVSSASDSLGGLVAFQAGAGVQSGVAAFRLRGTAASDLALFGSRERWEVAALGGVALGGRAQVFAGAGVGWTGASKRPGLFCSVCETRVSPRTLGLALALDATIQTPGLARIGVQAWANVNDYNPVAGLGVVVGLGG